VFNLIVIVFGFANACHFYWYSNYNIVHSLIFFVLFFFNASLSFQIVDEIVPACYRMVFHQLRKLFIFFNGFLILGLSFANSSLYMCFSKGLFAIFIRFCYKIFRGKSNFLSSPISGDPLS